MTRVERDRARKRARSVLVHATPEAIHQDMLSRLQELEKRLPEQAAITGFWKQVEFKGDRASLDRSALCAYLSVLYSSILGVQVTQAAPSNPEVDKQPEPVETSSTDSATQTEPLESFMPASPSASLEADVTSDDRALQLRIIGLPEATTGSEVEEAERFFQDHMRMVCPGIEAAYRVGIPRPDRPRHILVRFRERRDRLYVLQHGRHLRGTSFSVQEDLTLAQLSGRGEELRKVREARAQRKWAVYRGGAAIIRDQWPPDPWLGYA